MDKFNLAFETDLDSDIFVEVRTATKYSTQLRLCKAIEQQQVFGLFILPLASSCLHSFGAV